MIGRRNEDCVDSGIVEYFPEISGRRCGRPGTVLHDLCGSVQSLLIDIADLDDSDILPSRQELQVICSHAAAADEAQPNRI